MACAEHAAGWSIGLDALGLDALGRVSLAVGTCNGPVSVASATPLAADRWVEIVARMPGGPGRLDLSVRPRDGESGPEGDAEAQVTGVLIGAPVVASRGPLRWGCRSLFDGVRPELPFDGVVANVALTTADGHDSGGAVSMSWGREELAGFPA